MNFIEKKKLHGVWAGMKRRCYNSNESNYERYGGRGIKVCDSWLKFENFLADMAPTYKQGLSLDRVDNNGNYELQNCKWSTLLEQGQNKRNNFWITYEGVTDTLTNWAKFIGVKKTTLYMRLTVYNWNIEKSLKKGGLLS